MAKKKVTPETETKQVKKMELNECFFELFSLERLLQTYVNRDADISSPEKDVLLLLVRGVIKKVDYLQDKYGFEVDATDQYFVEDLIEFARKLPAETE